MTRRDAAGQDARIQSTNFVAVQDNSCCTRSCPTPTGPDRDGELWVCPGCSQTYEHATQGWFSFWKPIDDKLLGMVSGIQTSPVPISETANVGAVRTFWEPVTWFAVAGIAGFMIGAASALWFCSLCL